jgi:hypothetical protein
MEIIKEERGRKLSPECVEVFTSLMRNMGNDPWERPRKQDGIHPLQGGLTDNPNSILNEKIMMGRWKGNRNIWKS